MMTQWPVNTGATRPPFNQGEFMRSPEFLRRLEPILKTIEATPAIKDIDFDRNPLTGNVGTTVARSRKIIPLLQALRLNRREIDKVYPECIRLAVVGILELRIQRRLVTDRQIDKFQLGYRANAAGKPQPVLVLSNEDKRLLNRWAVLTKMPGAAQVWTSEQFNLGYWESIILKIDSLPKRSVIEVPKGDPRIVTVQSRRPSLGLSGTLALFGLGMLAVSQCVLGDSVQAPSDRAVGDIVDPRMLEPTFTDIRPLSEIFVGGPTSAKTKFAQDIVTRVDHEMKKIESLFVDKETFRQMVLGDTRLTEFNDGHPFTGSGKVVRVGGVREEGRFVDGRLHGNGTRIDSSGFQFMGPFNNGKQHGKGHRYTAGGATVFGEFDGSNLTGFGRYIIGSDDYQGEFLNNMRSGIGVNRVRNTPFWFVGISANNEIVRGERYHEVWSSGTYIQKDGKGVWMSQGQGEIHYNDGIVEIGEFVGDRLHGVGKLVIPGRRDVAGTFRNGFVVGHCWLKFHAVGMGRTGEWESGTCSTSDAGPNIGELAFLPDSEVTDGDLKHDRPSKTNDEDPNTVVYIAVGIVSLTVLFKMVLVWLESQDKIRTLQANQRAVAAVHARLDTQKEVLRSSVMAEGIGQLLTMGLPITGEDGAGTLTGVADELIAINGPAHWGLVDQSGVARIQHYFRNTLEGYVQRLEKKFVELASRWPLLLDHDTLDRELDSVATPWADLEALVIGMDLIPTIQQKSTAIRGGHDRCYEFDPLIMETVSIIKSKITTISRDPDYTDVKKAMDGFSLAAFKETYAVFKVDMDSLNDLKMSINEYSNHIDTLVSGEGIAGKPGQVIDAYHRLDRVVKDYGRLKARVDEQGRSYKLTCANCTRFLEQMGKERLEQLATKYPGFRPAVTTLIESDIINWDAIPRGRGAVSRAGSGGWDDVAGTAATALSIGSVDSSGLLTHYTRLNALLSALKNGEYDEDSAPDMALLNLHFGFFMAMLTLHDPLAFDSDKPDHGSRHIESVCRRRNDKHFQTDATIFLYRAHEDQHWFYEGQDRRKLESRTLDRDHIEFPGDAIQTSKRLAIALFIDERIADINYVARTKGFYLVPKAVARNLHVVTLTSDKVTLLIDYLEKWGREVPVRTGGSHGRLQVPFAMPSELQSTRQFNDVFLALQLFANY
jgi:hypothetical protein